MKSLPIFLLMALLFASCRVQRIPEAGKAVCYVRQNANLELYADSVDLELLPVKNTYVTLRRGTQVAVAEWEIHPEDSIDTVWVKVVHNAELQGWISQKHLHEAFVPTDSISQFIHFFSGIHPFYLLAPALLYVVFVLLRVRAKKTVHIPLFRDIESLYPMSLCLLVSAAAVIYATVQSFMPDVWLVYYYSPTLSPSDVPGVLSFFLVVLWLALIVGLAAVDEAFKKLPPFEAVLYLWGLGAFSIFCYFFFVSLTEYYVGYFALIALVVLYAKRVSHLHGLVYHCGNCGQVMREKGICPRCGARND